MGENHHFWWVISYYLWIAKSKCPDLPSCTNFNAHSWKLVDRSTNDRRQVRRESGSRANIASPEKGIAPWEIWFVSKWRRPIFKWWIHSGKSWKIMENFKFNGTCYFSSFYEYFQWEQLMIYQQFWWYFFQTKKWMHRIDVRNDILLVANSTNNASFIADLQDLFTRSAGHPDWKPHIPTQWYGRDRSHHGEGESSP